MRPIVYILVIALSALLALPAMAQDQAATLDGLKQKLATIEASITENAQDDTRLVKLRQDLDALSKSVIDFGVSFRPQLNSINSRMAELGTPPKDGEPAEPEIVTQERNSLTAEKLTVNNMLGDAESLSIRISTAIDTIGTFRRDLFTTTLLRKTDSAGAFGAETWRAFRSELSIAWRTVVSRVQFMRNFRFQSLALAGGLSAILGLAVFVLIRKLFAPAFARTGGDGNLSYISRLSLAFWSTVIPSLGFAASLGVVIALARYYSIFAGDSQAIVEAFLISAIAIFFIQRLANALFSPRNREWRLIPVTDGAATALVILTVAMAVVHILDFFLGSLNEILSSPLSLTVAKSMISSLVVSFLLILIAIVRPFRDAASGRSLPWPALIRVPIILLAGFVILAAVTGYIGLARFSAAQIVVTSAILATMYIGMQSGQVLASEGGLPTTALGDQLKNRFTLNDTSLDQLGLLLSFIVYGLVALIGIPLIALQWGFNWVDISSWLYRILTDIRIGSMSISLLGILFGIAVFIVGFIMTRRFQRWLDGSVMARSRVDVGVRNSIRTVVGYAGVALAGLIGLSAAGFDLSNLAIIAGALSLGIGFGLQNIVNNFVSGLILLVERPFKVGDWVVAGTTAGFVRKISVRATEIETFQRQTVILPNSEFINSAVGNWTHRNHLGRVDIPVGVAYGSKPRAVYDLLLEIGAADPSVLKNPAPQCVFLGFGASSLDFELRVHIAEVLDIAVVGTRLRLSIFETFEQHGIDIPFPQQDVHLNIKDLDAVARAFTGRSNENSS
ncbi:MAG: mechanosensitive ion channel domain-containing protein [Rhizobiaceae bacterium]